MIHNMYRRMDHRLSVPHSTQPLGLYADNFKISLNIVRTDYSVFLNNCKVLVHFGLFWSILVYFGPHVFKVQFEISGLNWTKMDHN